MSLLLVLPAWLASDSSKLLLFITAIAALYVIMRIVARRSETAQQFPAHDFGAAERNAQISSTGPAVHQPMKFDKIELRSFYMREFDATTGPPDPFEFVDEITAEVDHLETGARSKWEFTIGTPSGFARLLEGKGWESFFSPEVFVIRKYELEIVREMIVDHITAVLSEPGRTPVMPPKQPHE